MCINPPRTMQRTRSYREFPLGKERFIRQCIDCSVVQYSDPSIGRHVPHQHKQEFNITLFKCLVERQVTAYLLKTARVQLLTHKYLSRIIL